MSAPSSNINFQSITHPISPNTHARDTVGSATRMRPKHHALFRDLYSMYLLPGITVREVRMLVADKREVLTEGDQFDNDDLVQDIMTRVGKGPAQLQKPLSAVIPIIERTLHGGTCS